MEGLTPRRVNERLRRPVRVRTTPACRATAIERRGVEMVLTLERLTAEQGYLDGRYIPNLELAHHPFRSRKTYEDYVGRKALDRIGKKRWNKRVRRVIAQVLPVWNPRRLYLGGGNAKHLKGELPEIVTITSNIAGLMGGIALWNDSAPGAKAD